MTERSEEAHHVAEFHMGKGESLRAREELRPEVRASQIQGHTTWAVKRSLAEPLKNSSIRDVQTTDEHHRACMSSGSTQNPPALQFRSNDNKCNKSPVRYAQPRGAATTIHSAAHSPVRRIQ